MRSKKKIISIALVMIMLMSFCDGFYSASATSVEELSEKDQKQVYDAQAEIESLNKEIENNKKKIKELEKNKEDTEQTMASIQEEIDAYQAQIDSYQFKVDNLNVQIRDYNNKITAIETQITETEEKMAAQQKEIKETQILLGKRIRASYMAGNTSKLALVLSSQGLQELYDRVELVKFITNHDNQMVENLRAQIKVFEDTKAELEKQKEDLESSKSVIEDAKAEVVSAQNEIKASKSVVDAKYETLNKYIEKLDRQSAEYQSYEAKMEGQKDAYMMKIDQLLNGRVSTGDGNDVTLVWPVPYKNSYISSPFYMRTLNGETKFHYGIDIVVPGASSGNVIINAAGSGVVVIAKDDCSHNYPKNASCGCNGGYGRYIVIDHGDGVRAYYAHLNKVLVKEGDIVEQGQQIATMGCTGYSTGHHLHFELRVGSGARADTAKNPLDYVTQGVY